MIEKHKGNNDGILLMHFGMTGMIKIRNVESHLLFMENGGDKKILERIKTFDDGKSKTGKVSKYFKQEISDTIHIPETEKEIEEKVLATENDKSLKEELTLYADDLEDINEEWPPKFSKLEMVLEKQNEDKLNLSFVDPRRLGRIRFLSGPLVSTDELLLKQSPLVELGPDYSKSPIPLKQNEDFKFGDPDPDHHGRPRLSIEEFQKLVLSKKKPIKSLLLDQTVFAGVGNWVGDEILYHARIHPNEIISSKLTLKTSGQVHEVIRNLYNSLIYVCEESVRVEGDVTKFPDDWLMLYRWGKARKNSPPAKTKNGFIVDHITVGGRTSCFVPELQKPLEKEKKESVDEDENIKSEESPKKKRTVSKTNKADETPKKKPRVSKAATSEDTPKKKPRAPKKVK